MQREKEGVINLPEAALFDRLELIARCDCGELVEKGRHYGDSWKRRGGVGAFMMLARKWDRLEEAVKKNTWDIFTAHKIDGRSEGILDDIRDLRRYLLLVEDELTRDPYTEMAPMVSRSVAAAARNISVQEDRTTEMSTNVNTDAAVG